MAKSRGNSAGKSASRSTKSASRTQGPKSKSKPSGGKGARTSFSSSTQSRAGRDTSSYKRVGSEKTDKQLSKTKTPVRDSSEKKKDDKSSKGSFAPNKERGILKYATKGSENGQTGGSTRKSSYGRADDIKYTKGTALASKNKGNVVNSLIPITENVEKSERSKKKAAARIKANGGVVSRSSFADKRASKAKGKKKK